MNKKLMFFSMFMAISAISMGTMTYATDQNQVEPMAIQTISATMVDISLEMLVEAADYAIVGEVISITPVVYVDSNRDADRKSNNNSELIILDKEILSDVTIKVEKDLFEKYNEQFITVRVPGGEMENQKTIHESSPEFVKGERVIVFVGNGQSYSISEDNYTVLGLEQGTVRLSDNVVSKFATDNMSENDIKNKIKSLV